MCVHALTEAACCGDRLYQCEQSERLASCTLLASHASIHLTGSHRVHQHVKEARTFVLRETEPLSQCVLGLRLVLASAVDGRCEKVRFVVSFCVSSFHCALRVHVNGLQMTASQVCFSLLCPGACDRHSSRLASRGQEQQ